jgi:oxygen-independent coproporphyrinogen-3 oxidase
MLQREAEGWRRQLNVRGVPDEFFGKSVDSAYLGGGTPSLLGAERLALVVGVLRENLRWADDIEFTLETTPGSAGADLLEAFLGLGINRLSIGAQTFDDRELGSTGRLHTVNDTVDLVNQARRAGFRNIGLDLIAGLPYQSAESFKRSLEAVSRLRPEHISLYLFEVDEKSRLGREVVHGGERYHAASVPRDEFMADAYETGCEFLARDGYRQYEISNFALPGFESRHNRKYWQLAPYLGLGAGAHSFDGEHRWSNQIDVRKYLATLESDAAPVEEFHELTAAEEIEEFFFLGLRQVEGVDLAGARQHWGAEYLNPWEKKIETLDREGWVIREGEQLRLARHAFLVSNEIFQEFVSV